jgi:hypothetical protein
LGRAVAVVPIRPLAERKVAEAFLDARAVSMADAMAYVPEGPSADRAFERLKGADVLKTNGQGKWWLVEERWEDRRTGRRSRVVFAVLALGVAAAVAARR